jgi:hypothetical protein
VDDLTKAVVLRIDFGPALGHALTLRKDNAGRGVEVRRQARKNGVWVDLENLATATPGSWPLNQRCDFEFDFDGTELTVRWSESAGSDRWRQWSGKPSGTLVRPVFTIEVTEGFGEFHDLKVVGG